MLKQNADVLSGTTILISDLTNITHVMSNKDDLLIF